MRGTMPPGGLPDVTVVEKAQRGDKRALDELVRAYLPLVYNVVGRALDGHPDVDDIVQETLLRATHRLGDLRDPSRFRSWLIAIAMRQVRDHWRATHGNEPLQPEAADALDPRSDFVDVTILRLGLSGQRRETAEASRWLHAEERVLLSLWWQEAAGSLTRDELAEALGVSVAHAGVRVQRMKNRLDTARQVVRALAARPQCPELAAVTAHWNGRPSALWRKRVARHLRTCPRCAEHAMGLAPVEGLLAGLALVPLPVGYLVAAKLLADASAGTGAGVAAGAVADGATRLTAVLTLKHAAVAATSVAVLGAGVGGYVQWGPDPAEPPAATRPTVTDRASRSPEPTREPAARSTSEPPPSPSSSAPPRGVYGQTVDAAEPAPDPGTPPAPLPGRPESTPVTAKEGSYRDASGGGYLMTYRDQHVVLSGRGYVRVGYELGHDGRHGPMVMPTWTGLRGRLFHVASGGGHRMDDAVPGAPEGTTWMGSPQDGFMELPEGAQQMWQDEYFYLDGQVTLGNHERGSDYNLVIHPVTRSDITDDVNRAPGSAPDVVRYGLVRDTGDDSAPVPQYLTRDRPGDPVAEVPQRTRVGPE